MIRAWKRLLLAGLLSTFLFGAVSLWYYLDSRGTRVANIHKPVAYLEFSKDEILRRPAQRQVWQQINDGDTVYAGEAIRTSDNGEVRIHFLDNQRFIDMEPSSIVMITQPHAQELSLDLMEGSAVVGGAASVASTDATAANPQNNSKLTLSSAGGKKVELSGASTVLSRKSDQMSVEVDDKSGQSAAGALSDSRFADFLIEAPLSETPLLVDVVSNENVKFIWSGAPTDVRAQVQFGTKRTVLDSHVDAKGMQAQTPLKPGKYYFKVAFLDNKTSASIFESKVLSFRLLPRVMPVILSPAPQEKIETENDKAKVLFRWNRPETVSNYYLEVASDSTLQKKVVSEALDKIDHYESQLPAGHYYARLSVQFNGEDQVRSGKIVHFQIISKEFHMREITWIEKEKDGVQYYYDQPISQLNWKAEIGAPVKTYRLKIADSIEDLATPQATTLSVSDTQYKMKMPGPGRYIASLEGLDENSKVVAESSVKSFEVKPYPGLKAPELLAEGDLKSTNDGRLDVRWKTLPGAQEYQLEIYDATNKLVQKRNTRELAAVFDDLLPGHLHLQISAVDQHGRPGEKDTRQVEVPDGTSLKVPKFKGVKLKK